MRERVEDLGRVAVLIDNVIDHDLFEEYLVRPKEFAEWFSNQTEDKKYDILHRYAYGRQDVLDLLYKIREIARGEDILNENVDGLIIK